METWIVWSSNTGRIRSYDPLCIYDPLDKMYERLINRALEQSIKVAEEDRRRMLLPKKLNEGGK